MKSKYLIILSILGILLAIATGCKKDDDPIKPTVTTEQVTSITPSTANCGGDITADGGASVTARGVVWGTAENPTVNSNTGITTDGTGTGNFTSSLAGLTPGTTYYVRAYATNIIGTTYGNEINFTTASNTIINSDGITGILTDEEGNTYKIVKIGNQWWMAENLKVTYYNDGTAIPNVTDNDEWPALTTGAYCWYSNDETTYKDTYGALYNWYAVNTGKLAPTGWHVPTDAEWTTLTDYIASDGHSGAEGTALKATSGWYSDGNGTNDYGFTALPGGGRYDDGAFDDIGYYGSWWSATEYDSDYTWRWDMSYSTSSVSRHGLFHKVNGFSVRCVRD